jgi:hypothetical protein
MRVGDVYGGQLLTSADLTPGVPLIGTIVSVGMYSRNGSGSDADAKLQLELDSTEKSFVCNKTNAQYIAGKLGDETDAWVSARIRIERTRTMFKGQMVDCLRVTGAKKGTAQVKPASTPIPEDAPVISDDSIPF